MTDKYYFIKDIFDCESIYKLFYNDCTLKIKINDIPIGTKFKSIVIDLYDTIRIYKTDNIGRFPDYKFRYKILVNDIKFDNLYDLDEYTCLFNLSYGSKKCKDIYNNDIVKINNGIIDIRCVKSHKNTILYPENFILRNIELDRYNGKLSILDDTYSYKIKLYNI